MIAVVNATIKAVVVERYGGAEVLALKVKRRDAEAALASPGSAYPPSALAERSAGAGGSSADDHPDFARGRRARSGARG